MKTSLLVMCLFLAAASTATSAPQKVLSLDEATALFFTHSNKFALCGMRITAPKVGITIRNANMESFDASFISQTIWLDWSRDARTPHFFVMNYESQYWLRLLDKSPANTNYQFKLTREQAEARAKLFAGHLGPQIDAGYRFHPCEWPMSRNHYPDAGARSWAFSWHRHVGEYPVMTETIEAVVDDATGGFAKYHSHVRDEAYALIEHPVPTPAAARKGIEQVIHKGYGLDPAKPEKGYLHHVGGPFLVVASPRVLTAEQNAKLGKTAKGEQRVRLAWAYHFWISYSGKPTEERIKRLLHSGEATRGLFDAETFEFIPL